MDLYGRPDAVKVAAVVIIGAVLAAILLCWAVSVRAERPGDTVELIAFCRDSIGVPIVPDSARLFVYRDTTLVQSSQTLANSKIKKGQTYRLKAKYTIPTSTPDSARFTFYIRAKGDGILDYYPCTPATVLMHDGTVDSLAPGAVSDLYVNQATSTFATIDSTDGGGIYLSGAKVTGAFVFAHTGQYNPIGTNIGFGTSRTGDYSLTIPISATAADTFYVSAWYQNSWLKTATQVIVP